MFYSFFGMRCTQDDFDAIYGGRQPRYTAICLSSGFNSLFYVHVMRVTKYAYFLFLTLFRCSFICVRDDDSPKRNGDVSGDEEEEEVFISRE